MRLPGGGRPLYEVRSDRFVQRKRCRSFAAKMQKVPPRHGARRVSGAEIRDKYQSAFRPIATYTARSAVTARRRSRRSIAGDESLFWVGLSRPAGRKRRSARVPPGVRVRKRRAPCSCAPARHSHLRRGPCKALLASPFRPRLGVRCGWSPFPKDSSHGQTTR